MRSAASTPDPFLAPLFNAVLELSRVGKVRSFPGLRPGEVTGNFMLAGQSLIAGSSEGLYTPTNANFVDNLNQFNGEIVKASDPLVGASLADSPLRQASPFTRVADQLVTAGDFDRVVLTPAAYGGTTIAQWDADLHKHIINGYRRSVALGIPITAILWQLGETDNALGTSQASYYASFVSMRTKVIAAGCTAPWILAKSTYIPGGLTSAAIRAAITALVDNVNIFAGPDCDTLNGTYRYDDQHWNAAGNAAAAALWTSAIRAALRL